MDAQNASTSRLDRIETLLGKVTLGDAEVWPDWDEEGETGHFCIGNRECTSLVTCGEGTETDAEFVALAKAMMPKLIEGMRLLGKLAATPSHPRLQQEALQLLDEFK